MARITARSSIPALAVGLLDAGVEQAMAGKEFFGVPVDLWVSGALTVGSAVVNYMGKETEVSEKVFYASLPLFLKRLIPTIASKFQGGVTAVAVPRATRPAPKPAAKSSPSASGRLS